MKPSEVAAREFFGCLNGRHGDRCLRAHETEFGCECLSALLDRFAGERVLEERERCAKVAEDQSPKGRPSLWNPAESGAARACSNIAAALRSAPGGGSDSAAGRGGKS